MSINFNKMLLMSGDDFKLTDSITLHHPTIGEILTLGNGYHSENIYWRYIHTLMCDPYVNMVLLDDLGKNFMEVSPFEMFIIQWEQLEKDYHNNSSEYDLSNIKPHNLVLSALDFFIVEKHEFTLRSYEDGTPCLVDIENPNCQIDQEVFDLIYEWLKSINKIDYSDRINPADENARLILIEDTRDEIKKAKRRKKKNDDNTEHLGNLMSAISFGGNGVITPFNIKKCKVYWILEAFSVENKKTNASHILDGVYHGTINSKDVNKNELDWTK